MQSGIYIIQNKVNNKVYVGSAVDIQKRWERHKKDLRKGNHHSVLLQRSWEKYGEESFQFIVIEPVKNSLHLIAVEQTFLDYYKSYDPEKGYNICRTAGSQLGLKRSKETKRKMSEANKGRTHSAEAKRKMRENNPKRKNAKGYCFHKAAGKYLARIYINGKRQYLGLYDTEQEALDAYLKALEIVPGE